METELMIVGGKICFILPPVREAKKVQLATARVTLSSDKESVTVTCRGHEKILEVSRVGEPQERVDGNFIVVTQSFAVKIGAEVASLTFEVERQLTPTAKAAFEQGRVLYEARLLEESALKLRALQKIREKLTDELIAKIAKDLRFSRHNQLWGWKHRYIWFVCEIFRSETWFPLGSTFGTVWLSSLPEEEIEAVRMRLWAQCERLRAEKKEQWLSSH